MESAALDHARAAEELWAVGEALCWAATVLFATGLSEVGDRMLEQAVGVFDLLAGLHAGHRARPQSFSAGPRT